MDATVQTGDAHAEVIRRGVPAEARAESRNAACRFTDGGTIVVSSHLAAHIRLGDEISFPLTIDSASAGTELYVRTARSSGRAKDLYQAPIRYAAQPKADKREQLYVRAEVSSGRLGISSVHLLCDVLRDHFYVADRGRPWERQPSLYDILRATPANTLAELRLAFKLRQLELCAAGASSHDHGAVERAFNILAQPELRACYDSLLKDLSAPVLFPYGGFGSILVSGDRSRDGHTFFAARILSFQPEQRERRFHAPLRRFDFHSDRAIYRDARRKLELTLDQSSVPIVWDGTWNRWKHLLSAKAELQGTFVRTGRYRHWHGEWHLIQWETALPSRVRARLPTDVAEQVETARRSYHRFGEFSEALSQIRDRIEQEPMEREQLRGLCWNLGLPGDFDVAQISWKPDYDHFFYRQLCRRARRLYLFRDEYLFELEREIAAETPQLGHATYLFSKPRSIEGFLATYTGATKEAIRQNRANLAERLGFLGRVVHGSNPKIWLRALKQRLGEAVDYAQVASD